MPDTNGGPKPGKNKKKELLIGAAILGVILLFLFTRKKSSSSGTTTATTTQTAALAQYQQQTQAELTTLASQLQDIHSVVVGHMSSSGSGVASTSSTVTLTPVTQTLMTMLRQALLTDHRTNTTGKTTTTQTQTPPPGPPGTATAALNYGYGVVNTKLGQMIDLGVVGGTVYQVGGGEPVFFGNATDLQQGASSPGEDVYTPISAASWVSSKPQKG